MLIIGFINWTDARLCFTNFKEIKNPVTFHQTCENFFKVNVRCQYFLACCQFTFKSMLLVCKRKDVRSEKSYHCLLYSVLTSMPLLNSEYCRIEIQFCNKVHHLERCRPRGLRMNPHVEQRKVPIKKQESVKRNV